MLLPVGSPWAGVKIGVVWLYVQMGAAVGVLRTMDWLGWLPTGLLLAPPAPWLGIPILPK